jgi:predicted unusual protein kinase regulating ubiquinone biosynthesis (AarF/ABC1/UbiB family)
LAEASPQRVRKPFRPTAQRRRRALKAYRVTLTVIASYLWLRVKRRLFGTAYYDRTIVMVHRKNARRIERALIELQGLFIKVGQLLSIMANFLPDEFRAELEGMQRPAPSRRSKRACRRSSARTPISSSSASSACRSPPPRSAKCTKRRSPTGHAAR